MFFDYIIIDDTIDAPLCVLVVMARGNALNLTSKFLPQTVSPVPRNN